jgi:CDP-diacylglycerol--serine O-phosphatidyltransferase
LLFTRPVQRVIQSAAIFSDVSRDPRIEDPTNLWIIHPLGRALLPVALRMGLSANQISAAGLLIGGAAAAAYLDWSDWRYASLGFALSVAWLVADGLDGMVARATGTASAFGRFMDGICDHGVFLLFYIVLAISVGSAAGWILAATAACAHAVQSSLYEAERSRFHRRRRGQAALPGPGSSPNLLVRAYDSIGASLDARAARFDEMLGHSRTPAEFGDAYARRAVPAFAILRWLSANVRVGAIYVACLIGDPKLFWWFEIVPLSGIAAYGIIRHRRIETVLISEVLNAEWITGAGRPPQPEKTK